MNIVERGLLKKFNDAEAQLLAAADEYKTKGVSGELYTISVSFWQSLHTWLESVRRI